MVQCYQVQGEARYEINEGESACVNETGYIGDILPDDVKVSKENGT
jgi:hypothetical protein